MRRKLIIIVLAVLFLIIGYVGYQNPERSGDIEIELSKEKVQANHVISEDIANEELDVIYVHISGAVSFPGMLELPAGSRLIDAIDHAGGLLESAAVDEINLSKILRDEEKIHIPQEGEVISSQNSSSGGNDLININYATKEELCKIPGLGPVTADKIIAYREEQKITSREQLLEIPGIGEKKLEQYEEHITY